MAGMNDDPFLVAEYDQMVMEARRGFPRLLSKYESRVSQLGEIGAMSQLIEELMARDHDMLVADVVLCLLGHRVIGEKGVDHG